MTEISPDAATLAALAARGDAGPIVMLNLLKFKADGGGAAYARYAAAVEPLIAAHGGRLVYAGRAELPVVSGETWDVVALIEYPSARALLDMIGSAAYQAAAADRTAGLERTVVYLTTPAPIGPPRP